MSRLCCKPWDHRTSRLFPGGRNRCAGSAPSCATLLYEDSRQAAMSGHCIRYSPPPACLLPSGLPNIPSRSGWGPSPRRGRPCGSGGTDEDHRGSLKDSLQTLPGAGVRTVGQSFVMRVIDAEVFSTLLNQDLRPRLNVGGLKVPGFAQPDIADGAIGADHLPQTRQIGFPIGGARRWGGEIRFAISGARDAGRATFQPLRLERRHQDSQKDHGCEDLHRLVYLPYPPTIRLRRAGWYAASGELEQPHRGPKKHISARAA